MSDDTHTHETMTPEELRDHNVQELNKGIQDLIVYNESRLALLRDKENPWVEVQFEMMSMKLDILVDALCGLASPDKEVLTLEYGISFQVRLARFLDSLFPQPDTSDLET